MEKIVQSADDNTIHYRRLLCPYKKKRKRDIKKKSGDAVDGVSSEE